MTRSTPLTRLHALLVGSALLGALALIALLSRSPAFSPAFLTLSQPASQATTLSTQLYHLRLSAVHSGWSAELHRQAGDLLAQRGDAQAAAAHWQAALTLQPDQPGLVRRLAEHALNAERWTQAADLLARWLAVQPDDPWGSAWLGLLYATAQPGQALPLLEAAGSAEAEAVHAVQAVLRAHPLNDPALAFRVGSALAGVGYWSLAERAFFQAAALAVPSTGLFAEAAAYVGVARAAQRKPSAAAWVSYALEAAPLNPQVHTLHAAYLELTGDAAGAGLALQTAARLDPTDPALAALVGQHYQARGDASTAEYWLRLSVALAGDDRYDALLAAFYDDYAAQLDALRVAEQRAVLEVMLRTPDAQMALQAVVGMLRLLAPSP